MIHTVPNGFACSVYLPTCVGFAEQFVHAPIPGELLAERTRDFSGHAK